MEYYDRLVASAGAVVLPRYAPADLEAIIDVEAVGTGIVTSPDRARADRVGRVLNADTIVEAPLIFGVGVPGDLSVAGSHDGILRPALTVVPRRAPRAAPPRYISSLNAWLTSPAADHGNALVRGA